MSTKKYVPLNYILLDAYYRFAAENYFYYLHFVIDISQLNEKQQKVLRSNPRYNKENDSIVLNLSVNACKNIEYTPEGMFYATAAFGGVPHNLEIPLSAFVCILLNIDDHEVMPVMFPEYDKRFFRPQTQDKPTSVNVETGHLSLVLEKAKVVDTKVADVATEPKEEINSIDKEYQKTVENNFNTLATMLQKSWVASKASQSFKVKSLKAKTLVILDSFFDHVNQGNDVNNELIRQVNSLYQLIKNYELDEATYYTLIKKFIGMSYYHGVIKGIREVNVIDSTAQVKSIEDRMAVLVSEARIVVKQYINIYKVKGTGHQRPTLVLIKGGKE